MKTTLFLLCLFLSNFTFAGELKIQKSSFVWHGTKIVGSGHSGTIQMSKSFLSEEKGSLSGEFVADMNSITVTDLEGERKAKFENHMKSEDFFEIEKFPTATFIIEKSDAQKIYGKLSIKGKIQEISVPYTKDKSTYNAVLEFDRTKFGLIYASQSFFKNLVGDRVINDTIKLEIKITLK